VNGTSYLYSIYGEITCRLVNGATVRPRFSDSTRDNKLAGAGTYSASAVITASLQGLAVKTCEVFLERIYEATNAGMRLWLTGKVRSRAAGTSHFTKIGIDTFDG
jgi:hypothetical protein